MAIDGKIEAKTVKIETLSNGRAYLEGRRITVDHVAEYFVYFGWEADRISDAFDLSLAEIYAAVSYYYANKEVIDQIIAKSRKPIEGPNIISGADILSGKYKLMMTTAEVAETYGISDRTVREAIEKGWIKARKSGGTWLIRRQDAEKRWDKKS